MKDLFASLRSYRNSSLFCFVGPIPGLQDFWTARRTLVDVEAMAMLAKGQVRAVPGNDIRAQRAFVHRVFGVAA